MNISSTDKSVYPYQVTDVWMQEEEKYGWRKKNIWLDYIYERKNYDNLKLHCKRTKFYLMKRKMNADYGLSTKMYSINI